MSFKIVNKQILSQDVKRVDVLAAEIVAAVKPGQFVGVIPQEGDERIPLSVIDTDSTKGSLTLVFREVGYTTRKLGEMGIGDNVFSILGPLGRPVVQNKKGRYVCIAMGIGSAQILPVCRSLQQNGSKVVGIIGAPRKRELLLESQMRLSCQKLFVATEDGSYERKGFVQDVLSGVFEKMEVDGIYAMGPSPMLKAVCSLAKEKNVPVSVFLNPIMTDCVGMCGSCRVKVDGEIKLACLEGPEFDGHKVDFEDYEIRLNAYEEQEVWQNQKSQLNPKRSESKTITRFLSGILKN